MWIKSWHNIISIYHWFQVYFVVSQLATIIRNNHFGHVKLWQCRVIFMFPSKDICDTRQGKEHVTGVFWFCLTWCSREVLSEAVNCCIRFILKMIFNMAVTESDLWPQGSKNDHKFLMTVRKMSWACVLVAKMLQILTKQFSIIRGQMTLQRNVPWFCMGSICGWNQTLEPLHVDPRSTCRSLICLHADPRSTCRSRIYM